VNAYVENVEVDKVLDGAMRAWPTGSIRQARSSPTKSRPSTARRRSQLAKRDWSSRASACGFWVFGTVARRAGPAVGDFVR
jgi:hypothetical protein